MGMERKDKLTRALAEDEKLAKLVAEAEKQGIKIVVADENEELPKAPKFERLPDEEVMARMVEYKMPIVPPIIDYPSGQESRRKRREMERKSKKRR